MRQRTGHCNDMQSTHEASKGGKLCSFFLSFFSFFTQVRPCFGKGRVADVLRCEKSQQSKCSDEKHMHGKQILFFFQTEHKKSKCSLPLTLSIVAIFFPCLFKGPSLKFSPRHIKICALISRALHPRGISRRGLLLCDWCSGCHPVTSELESDTVNALLLRGI
jgi:hypothetical protein